MMRRSNVPKIQFDEHQLASGLKLILHSCDRSPLVHVGLHYSVGSSFEVQGLSGFAHLFEHMMFQGSANVDKNEHGKYIDEAGGRWNASTNKDRTNYYETVPANFLKLAFWLEADRMASLKVTEENFENQRQTVIEEKKQSYDNRPYGLSYLRFDELAYQNWAYAHPIIGSVEDLRKATLQDALDFHELYYGPGNATLVVAGDIEPAETIAVVREYFESIPDSTSPREPDLDEPQQERSKFEIMADPLAVLPAVAIGYHMPGLGSPEYYALTMLALILADGDSSRFYRKFVYRNNWITGLFAGPNQYKGPQLFRVWFQIQDDVTPQTVIDAVDEEVSRIINEGVTDKELEKARNQVTHRFIARLSTVYQVGELLAHYASFFNEPGLVNTQIDEYHAITRGEVLNAAQKFLVPENRSIILTEPGSTHE
jgi:predicted Zn-dependent peptidase